MKLFGEFDAVKFPQENLILVTHMGYLYYLYEPKYKYWSKHRNAGNDHITISNYPDVSKKELTEAMQGKFPEKETDFMRLCAPSELNIRDMMGLLREDYAAYMSDYNIYHAVHRFLLESDICYKSYEKIRKLLDDAVANRYDNNRIFTEIKELSFEIIGRDIFKREIGIVDGHDGSSYFWIMPVRILDYSVDTKTMDNVAEMKSSEISIEEDDVYLYLTPFLYKHFDEELEANRNRSDVFGFEWYLEHNFFTFEQIECILKDIADTVDALSCGRETEYLNINRMAEDDTEVGLIIDFYQRFIYRMEYMMKVGKEKGYNLISFMGP